MAVLLNIQASGYALEVDHTGAFLAKKGGSTSYLRSNTEVLRFGKILADIAAREAGPD
jgi:hypothetical protein